MPSSWLVREDPWSKLVREGPRAVAAVESARIPERALLRRVLAIDPAHREARAGLADLLRSQGRREEARRFG